MKLFRCYRVILKPLLQDLRENLECISAKSLRLTLSLTVTQFAGGKLCYY